MCCEEGWAVDAVLIEKERFIFSAPPRGTSGHLYLSRLESLFFLEAQSLDPHPEGGRAQKKRFYRIKIHSQL